MTTKLYLHQHNVLLPRGHRIAAVGFMEALDLRTNTHQFWLCPGCDKINHNDYDPDKDDGSIGYTCESCGWDGTNDELMLGIIEK